jgi:hypothetical protein
MITDEWVQGLFRAHLKNVDADLAVPEALFARIAEAMARKALAEAGEEYDKVVAAANEEYEKAKR